MRANRILPHALVVLIVGGLASFAPSAAASGHQPCASVPLTTSCPLTASLAAVQDDYFEDEYYEDEFYADDYYFEDEYYDDPFYDDPYYDDPFYDDPYYEDEFFEDEPVAPATPRPAPQPGLGAPSIDPAAQKQGIGTLDDADAEVASPWAESDDAELYVALQAHLLTEIDVLTQLEAFNPTLRQFSVISERYGTPDRPRFQLIPELLEVDMAGPALLREFRARDLEISDSVVRALELLAPASVQSIRDGETNLVGAPAYIAALSDALYRQGRAVTTGKAELRVEEIEALLDSLGLSPRLVEDAQSGADFEAPTQQPTDLAFAQPEAEPTPEPTAETSGGISMGVLAAIAGAVVLLVGAIFVLVRRRPKGEAPTPSEADGPDMTAFLDASRRINQSLSPEEIATTTLSEAMALTDADGGAFLQYSETGDALLLMAERPAGLVVPEGLSRSSLARVAETGQPTYAVTNADPGLATVPVALAAVPVVANASVTGVIVIVRSDTHPFDATSVTRLETLAPMVGSALVAAHEHQSVSQMAHVDALTQLHNRRRLDQDLPVALEAAATHATPMCFVMADVDHFKTYNDTHGHGAGDVALQLVAELIRTNVREGDVVYRYGGEEFSILLPGADLDEAQEVAERVREAIEAAVFVGEDQQPGGCVTVSLGLAKACDDTPETLRHRADDALYEAKESGRNRVQTAP